MKFIRNLMGGHDEPEKTPENAGPVSDFSEVVATRELTAKVAKAAAAGRKEIPVDDAPVKHPPIRGEITQLNLDKKLADDSKAAKQAEEDAARLAKALGSAVVKADASDAAAKPAGGAAVNIWDMDDDDVDLSGAAPASPTRRASKTRVTGLDTVQDGVVDLHGEPTMVSGSHWSQFPVGWAIVIAGPGRGACFALEAGMNQIGRGDDQTVRLDFGDNAISRQNHAAIVFDAETNSFMVGHGGKSNIVRLNGEPLISNVPIKDGDVIRLGETTVMFKPLCTPDFNWADTPGDKEHDDVAIA